MLTMLTQQIKADMITAMKAKDDLRVQTLRGCMSAFTNELVAKNRKPTDVLEDAEAVTVLKRLAKQRKDSAEQFIKGGRPELAEKENAELKILEVYLPEGPSREAIEKVAREKMTILGISDAAGAGKLMGAVIKEFAGTADGAVVKDVVTSLLK
jgi:uncharacterized protein